MSGRARETMLRIRTLIDDLSPAELAEAINLLQVRQKQVLSVRAKNPSARRGRKGGAESSDLSKKGESRVLQQLKLEDEEKYQVLRDFETSVREGVLLKTLDDFRSFGTVLGKKFGPVKSVKDALPKVMGALATMDLDNIKSAIEKAATRNSNDENAFRRLANRIISGRSNITSRS